MVNKKNQASPCQQCLYYQVSWDANFPHLCRYWDIKTVNLPSLEVFRNTHIHCPVFQLKPCFKKSNSPNKNDNSPKNSQWYG